MASKTILFLLVLFVLQCSDAVKKRDIIEDMLAPIGAGIQQNINNGQAVLKDITQAASNIVQNAMSSMQNAMNDFNNNIQAQVKKAQQLGKDVTSCVVDSATKANNIVNKARKDVEDCTNAAIDPIRKLTADLFDLGNQAVQLIAGYPVQLAKCVESGIFGFLKCSFDTTTQTAARANLLGSSARSDTVNLGIQNALAIPKLGKCAAHGLSYVTNQFSILTTSEVSCILGVSK